MRMMRLDTHTSATQLRVRNIILIYCFNLHSMKMSDAEKQKLLLQQEIAKLSGE
jgi:hypothetical protein